MSKGSRHAGRRNAAGLIAAVTVFGLAALMILMRYDPAVILMVVTGTSLAAAELGRRLRAPIKLGAKRGDRPRAGS